ncbi:MAG: YdcF family protein [Bacillota bacterium]|nr:YdcF family protein [Bacillota bacterium]
MKIIDDITEFIFLENGPEPADIIFIPGGSYAEIAERAAELWTAGYSKLILPSGRYSVKRGYFPGPLSKTDKYNAKYTTEWEFLKGVLVRNGVDETAVLKEEQAENTYENAIYSKKVTDECNLNIRKAIICCKAFHARRCLMYYQLLYPETEILICPADTQGIGRENWYKSEKGIDRVLGELMRCGGQFGEIFKALL